MTSSSWYIDINGPLLPENETYIYPNDNRFSFTRNDQLLTIIFDHRNSSPGEEGCYLKVQYNFITREVVVYDDWLVTPKIIEHLFDNSDSLNYVYAIDK